MSRSIRILAAVLCLLLSLNLCAFGYETGAEDEAETTQYVSLKSLDINVKFSSLRFDEDSHKLILTLKIKNSSSVNYRFEGMAGAVNGQTAQVYDEQGPVNVLPASSGGKFNIVFSSPRDMKDWCAGGFAAANNSGYSCLWSPSLPQDANDVESVCLMFVLRSGDADPVFCEPVCFSGSGKKLSPEDVKISPVLTVSDGSCVLKDETPAHILSDEELAGVRVSGIYEAENLSGSGHLFAVSFENTNAFPVKLNFSLRGLNGMNFSPDKALLSGRESVLGPGWVVLPHQSITIAFNPENMVDRAEREALLSGDISSFCVKCSVMDCGTGAVLSSGYIIAGSPELSGGVSSNILLCHEDEFISVSAAACYSGNIPLIVKNISDQTVNIQPEPGCMLSGSISLTVRPVSIPPHDTAVLKLYNDGGDDFSSAAEDSTVYISLSLSAEDSSILGTADFEYPFFR